MLPRYSDGSTGAKPAKPKARKRSTSPSKNRKRGSKGGGLIGCCMWTLVLVWFVGAVWFGGTVMLRDKPHDALLGPMIFGPESKLGVMWEDTAERVVSMLESRHPVQGYAEAQKSLAAYHFERGEYVNLIRQKGEELKEAAQKLFQAVPILNSITSKGANVMRAVGQKVGEKLVNKATSTTRVSDPLPPREKVPSGEAGAGSAQEEADKLGLPKATTGGPSKLTDPATFQGDIQQDSAGSDGVGADGKATATHGQQADEAAQAQGMEHEVVEDTAGGADPLGKAGRGAGGAGHGGMTDGKSVGGEQDVDNLGARKVGEGDGAAGGQAEEQLGSPAVADILRKAKEKSMRGRGIDNRLAGRRGALGESPQQDMAPQGMGKNNMGQQGMANNNMAQQGMGEQGLGKEGMGEEGMGQAGMGQKGMDQRRMGQQGMDQQEMAQDRMGKQGMEKQALVPPVDNRYKDKPRPWDPKKVAVVIMAYPHDSTEELSQTIESLRALPHTKQHDVYVSQDHQNPKMNSFIVKLQSTGAIGHIVHKTPDPSHLHMRERAAQHQRMAMEAIFNMNQGYTHAIFMEDSVKLAPDFFDFFAGGAPLMDRDESIWCVSAWHELGYSEMDWDKSKLMRTTHFSGIAWMAKRELWLELSQQWPKESWIEWMSQDSTRAGRSCVIPEVSRVVRHGNPVYSKEEAIYERFNAKVLLSDLPSEKMTFVDTAYVVKEQYDAWLSGSVRRARVIDNPMRAEVPANSFGPFLLEYETAGFPVIARKYGLPDTPLGDYEGLTQVKLKGNLILLAKKGSRWTAMKNDMQ